MLYRNLLKIVVLLLLCVLLYIRTLLCGHPKRPRFRSCPSVRLPVWLLNRQLEGAKEPNLTAG